MRHTLNAQLVCLHRQAGKLNFYIPSRSGCNVPVKMLTAITESALRYGNVDVSWPVCEGKELWVSAGMVVGAQRVGRNCEGAIGC